MPALTRIGDKDTGHDSCSARPLASGSNNVIVDDKNAGRVKQDRYAVHGCDDHSPHTGVIASGSPDVFINDKPAGRIGDPVSCGGNVNEGSPDVFVN
jgi:uncharacterized Zn-binding protein involved in type VI secretion